jgi:TonB family protein
MRTRVRLFLAMVMGAGVTIGASAQEIRVAPEDAEKNLVRRIKPEYPDLAQRANISGIVILEIKIDEGGTPQVQRLITGHPMLVDAARKAVQQWRYRAFQVAGRDASVLTYVSVPFGRPGSDSLAYADKQLRLLAGYKPLADAAQAAILKQDYDGAATALEKLKPLVDGPGFPDEKWFYFQAMGQVSEARNDLTNAAAFYRQALEVYKNFNHESSEEAATNSALGHLYLRMEKVEPAREHLRRALVINRKSHKRVDVKYVEARQALGEEIAHQAALLAKLSPAKDAKPYCELLREFDAYLKPADRRVADSACN